MFNRLLQISPLQWSSHDRRSSRSCIDLALHRFWLIAYVLTSLSNGSARFAPLGRALSVLSAVVAALVSSHPVSARDPARPQRAANEAGAVQRINDGRLLRSPDAPRYDGDPGARPYAPAPLQPIPFQSSEPSDRAEFFPSARGDGRMSREERRRLRREIDEAGREVYRSRR